MSTLRLLEYLSPTNSMWIFNCRLRMNAFIIKIKHSQFWKLFTGLHITNLQYYHYFSTMAFPFHLLLLSFHASNTTRHFLNIPLFPSLVLPTSGPENVKFCWTHGQTKEGGERSFWLQPFLVLQEHFHRTLMIAISILHHSSLLLLFSTPSNTPPFEYEPPFE